MTGREGQGFTQEEIDRIILWGRCDLCGAPRMPRTYHNGIEHTSPMTMDEARAIGGEWERRLVCDNGHRQP